MAEECKSLDDDIEEFEGIEERVKILTMMKNIIRNEGYHKSLLNDRLCGQKI